MSYFPPSWDRGAAEILSSPNINASEKLKTLKNKFPETGGHPRINSSYWDSRKLKIYHHCSGNIFLHRIPTELCPSRYDPNLTIFLHAKYGMHNQLLEALAEDPASLHKIDEYGNSLLYYAASYGNERIVWFLSEMGLRDQDRRCYYSSYTGRVRRILRNFNDYSKENERKKKMQGTLNGCLENIFYKHNPPPQTKHSKSEPKANRSADSTQPSKESEETSKDVEFLPDLSLKIDGKQYHLHSWVLSARCPQFLQLLCEGINIVKCMQNKDGDNYHCPPEEMKRIQNQIAANKEKLADTFAPCFIGMRDYQVYQFFRYLYSGEYHLLLKASNGAASLSFEDHVNLSCVLLKLGMGNLSQFLMGKGKQPHSFKVSRYFSKVNNRSPLFKRVQAFVFEKQVLLAPLQPLVFTSENEKGEVVLSSDETTMLKQLVSFQSSDCVVQSNVNSQWKAAAHGELLVQRCSFFGPLFSDTWGRKCDSGRRIIELENVSTLPIAIRFLYTDRGSVNPDQALDLLYLSNLLQLSKLTEMADSVAIDNLEEDIVVPLLSLDISGDLKSACFHFMVSCIRRNPSEKWPRFSEEMSENGTPIGFIANMYEKLLGNGTILPPAPINEEIEEYFSKKKVKKVH